MELSLRNIELTNVGTPTSASIVIEKTGIMDLVWVGVTPIKDEKSVKWVYSKSLLKVKLFFFKCPNQQKYTLENIKKS